MATPTPSVFPIRPSANPRIIVSSLDDAMMTLIALRSSVQQSQISSQILGEMLTNIGIRLMLIRNELAASVNIGKMPTHEYLQSPQGANEMLDWMSSGEAHDCYNHD